MALSRLISFASGLALALAAGGLAGCDKPVPLDASSANVEHITSDEFNPKVAHSAQPVVVEFYNAWSGPSRQLAPMLESVAGNYPGKIRFVKVNVEESAGLAQNYEVRTLPTLIFFKGDKLVDRLPGVPTEADLKARLDALVAAP